MRRRHACVNLLGVAAAVLLACDDQGPRTPAHIVIAPNLPRVPMGGTRQLTASVVDEDGRAIDGEPVTFASSDPSDERAGSVYGIKGSFLFTPLRPHPRFQALLGKMNLA